MHTNYLYYASTWANGGPLLAQTLKQVNFWVCRAYCDKVIKLSDTIQPLPRAVVCNVHGVRRDFLEIGRQKRHTPILTLFASLLTPPTSCGPCATPDGFRPFDHNPRFPLPCILTSSLTNLPTNQLTIPRPCCSSIHPHRRAGLPFSGFRKGAYFLGKVLWAKGHRLLVEYLLLERARGSKLTHVDIYGKGEDLEEVVQHVTDAQLDISFFGATDHASPRLREYKVFINPSESEVLSTTTAEALAMGKFVVIQKHPSNDFFLQFRNTLVYETPDEFLQQLAHALATNPAPLSAQERHALSWEGATDRFLHAVRNCSAQELLPSLADHTARWVHTGIQKGGYLGDALRFSSGGGPISRQSWLTRERFRDAPLTDIVEHSVALQPPVAAQA